MATQRAWSALNDNRQARGVGPASAPLPISGAIQGVDQGLIDRTAAAWGYVVPGGRVEVSTGVSNHSPTNHAPGHALDFRVVRPDGSVVAWNDPEAIAAARIGRSLGVLGIGGGAEYMGGNHFHWDVSANGARTWSDSGANQSPIGYGQSEYASLISAATGQPVEAILAELGITPGQTPNFAPVGSGGAGGSYATGMGGTAGPIGGYQNNALAGLAGQQQQPPQQNAMAQERFMLDPRDFMVSNQFSFTPVQA
jgi:hypothetical protein